MYDVGDGYGQSERIQDNGRDYFTNNLTFLPKKKIPTAVNGAERLKKKKRGGGGGGAAEHLGHNFLRGQSLGMSFLEVLWHMP